MMSFIVVEMMFVPLISPYTIPLYYMRNFFQVKLKMKSEPQGVSKSIPWPLYRRYSISTIVGH